MAVNDSLRQNKTSDTAQIPPQIKPFHIFGLCKEVKNNLLFPDEEDTVIFPCGNHCVRYSVSQAWTKFIYSAESSRGIKALALSPDRRYLAVSESGNKWATITIFDLKDGKDCKIQVLKGKNYGVHEFVCMAFSADSQYLIGQSGGPMWKLFYWFLEKKELITSATITKSGSVSQVSFNPHNNREICVNGKGTFKIIKLMEESLKPTSTHHMDNDEVLCHMWWLSKDIIIVGTEAGNLLMLRFRKFSKLESPCGKRSFSDHRRTAISAITPYSNGFACSAGPGLVCLYKKTTDKDICRKICEISIPEGPDRSQELQSIASICFSPAEETLAISTERGQIYQFVLAADIGTTNKDEFRLLFHSAHLDSITSLSICTSKPLVATCSKDFSVHIWNYKTQSLEYFKKFDEEPRCVSMHLNGLSFLVGFSNSVNLMKIVNGKICNDRMISDILDCTECEINHDGNMVATISRNVINIYNLRTGSKRLELLHNKRVKSIKWSTDDSRLVSCGMDGHLCVWNTQTGAKEWMIKNDISYKDVTFSPNNGSVFTVDRNTLQEMMDGDNSQSKMPLGGASNTTIAMTHSGQKIFVGTSAGTVRVISYCNGKEKNMTEHKIHSGPIIKMVVTPCDQFLLTASKDGSLLISSIADKDGKIMAVNLRSQVHAKILQHPEEVLCTMGYLQDLELTNRKLKAELQFMTDERDHCLNVKEMECFNNISTLLQAHGENTESMLGQLQVEQMKNEDQKVSYRNELNEMKEKHAQELKEQEMCSLLVRAQEHERQTELAQKWKMMQEEYEEKLHRQQQAMEKNTQSYEARLLELQTKLEQEVKKSEETQKVLNTEAESELINVCYEYELELEKHQEARNSALGQLKHMEKNISTYHEQKLQIKKQATQISELEEELWRLKLKHQDANETIKQLQKEAKKPEKAISDLDEYNKNVQELEIKCITKETELDEVRVQSQMNLEERIQQSVQLNSTVVELEKKDQENKEALRKYTIEVNEKISNYERITVDLRQKLKAKNQALTMERQKVISTDNLVQRMKFDIHTCRDFVENPVKLKKHFATLHKRYIHEPDETNTVNLQVMLDHTANINRMEKIVARERERSARDLKTKESEWRAKYNMMCQAYQMLANDVQNDQKKHKKCASTVISPAKPKPILQPQAPADGKTKGNVMFKIWNKLPPINY